MRPSRTLTNLLALLATCVPMAAADSQPVGIVLATTGGAEFRRAGTSTWLVAKAGMALSTGDGLRTAASTLRFAFCPDKSAQTLIPGKTLLLPASNLAAMAQGAFSDRAPVASCDLPSIPEATAAMSRGGDGRPGAAADCSGERVDLLDALAQATQATQAGDTAKAIETYRKISCYEGATWTRGVLVRASELQRQGLAAPGGEETYALLIGISTYPKETPQGQLRYAHADAEAFAKFLKEGRGGTLPGDHIRLLTNEEATLAGIEEAVSTFVRNARGPRNSLILLLAGHGDYLPTKIDPLTGNVIEQAPFFLTYDSYAQEQNSTGLRMSRFRDIVAEQAMSFRRVIAFVDVCHAGHIEDTSDRELPEAVQRVFLQNQGLLGLMMATGRRGVAFESDKFGNGHGAFSYAVLEGLNSEVAPNANHEITFEALYDHVHNRVRGLTNDVQTPTKIEAQFRSAVLENVIGGRTIPLGAAVPLSEIETGRPGSPKAGAGPVLASQARPATAPRGEAEASVPEQSGESPSERSRRLRIDFEDRGQQILIRYLRGEQNAMDKSDFSLCAESFQAALEQAPFDAFDESRMLFCQGRAAIFDHTPQSYAAGRELLERAVLLDPERAYAYNALGIAYLEQARGDGANYDRAIAAFLDAIRFAPQWAYPLHNLALAYSERGDFRAASRAYEQAMRLAPNYSYLPYNLGLLNQNVNRLDEAERLYRQAIETAERARRLGIEPTTPQWRERAVVWNALATVEMARKRYKQAAAALDQARADDPGLPAAKHNLALVESRKGPSADAERLWREAIADDRPGLASRIALAGYLARNGREADARTEFEGLVAALGFPGGFPKLEALRNRLPFDAGLLELYGDTAAHLGRADDARAGYDAAIREYRSRPDRQRVQRKRAALTASAR